MIFLWEARGIANYDNLCHFGKQNLNIRIRIVWEEAKGFYCLNKGDVAIYPYMHFFCAYIDLSALSSSSSIKQGSSGSQKDAPTLRESL